MGIESAPAAAAPAPATASTASRLLGAAASVLPALRQAASRTGVDFDALFHTARLESGFNPAARARTSSATGLFQFIDSTWLATLQKHGAKHGISIGSRSQALALRTDPAVASIMAAEHMADNAAALSAKIGRAVGGTELYLAHFLGVGGAARFLSAMAVSPGMAASELLPAAARANRAIFTSRKTGTERSLREVFDLLQARFSGSSGASASGAHVLSAASASSTNSTATAPAPATAATTEAQRARRAAQAAYLLLAQLGAS